MNIFSKYVVIVLSLVVFSVSTGSAVASELVVVDMLQLESKSNAGKSLADNIKSKRDALKAEIEKEEKSITAKQKKLVEEKKNLSEEEFKKKAMAFDKEFKEKQLKFAKKRKAFEKSVVEAHSKLRSEVVSAVGDVSTKEGYKLVLSRQSVVIVEKSIDITAAAMKTLNDKVKSIPLK